MPRLSLVIPCYRDGRTLGRALDSIARQTRAPEEIVVVDDCSPEFELIRAAIGGHDAVRYVRNERNLGLAASRNRGLTEATGDIVAFMDADDEAHPQRLEWQLRYVDARTAVATGLQRIAPGGQAAVVHFDSAEIDTVKGVGTMIYANRLCGASLMAPVALLRSAGGYDESLRSCEDFDLWLRLLAQGVTVKRVRLPLYLYHDNPAGLSKRYRDITEYELRVVRKFLESGQLGRPDSLRAGLVLSVWLLRQRWRAEALADPDLREQAASNIKAILAPGWPMLAAIVRAAGASGLHRLVFPTEH